MPDKPTCPNCHSPTNRVIYCGLPGHLCTNEYCSTFTGLAAWVAPPIVSYDEDGMPGFVFVVYEGSHWVALWRWLTC